MLYWGTRTTFAGFIWLFILSETLFLPEDVDETAFFSSIILFVFPFFLDYINITQKYKGPYLKNIPLFFSIGTIVVGFGGLMSKTLAYNGNSLVIFDTIFISNWVVWIYLFLWVIFAGIDMGFVETDDSKNDRESMRKISKELWLKEKEEFNEKERVKSYL